MFVWEKNAQVGGLDVKLDLEIMRCVTSLPSITSFSTSGAATGSCAARSSPRGGITGPTITFKGKNFFPSANLRVVFLKADGSMGPHSDCVSTKDDFTGSFLQPIRRCRLHCPWQLRGCACDANQ